MVAGGSGTVDGRARQTLESALERSDETLSITPLREA